jgi:hypothetical protein
MDAPLIKNKILDILKRRGPSLPIQVAKELQLNSLFVSAFLSELAGEQKLKISHLKVGGSPLYFLQGQEKLLENFYKFLAPKEVEAFLLLRDKKLLKESEQDPAIRVALKYIKDFSVGFKTNNEIFWRYMLASEEEVNNLLEKSFSKSKQQSKEEPAKEPVVTKAIQEIKQEPKEEHKQIVVEETKPKIKKSTKPVKIKEAEESQEINPFNNPLVKLEKEQEKPKSEFALKILEIIEKKGYQVIKERESKNKEFNLIIQINSDLGPINFFTQARDKKSISETDLTKLVSIAQSIPLPALMLHTGELSKKAKEYAEKYFSILKTEKIK